MPWWPSLFKLADSIPFLTFGTSNAKSTNTATLRQHIAQLAREIASSVKAPGQFIDIDGGVGFSYRHPEAEVEITATAQHTLTLLQSLSGSMAIVLKMIQQQPKLQIDALADFEFAAGLGQILLGQPHTKRSALKVNAVSATALS